MTAVDMLCLAYSMKHGGRCVAGLNLESGEWIRPVSAAEDGTLSAASCRTDAGRPVQPLDVVRIPVGQARPAPHQPENWVVAQGEWTLRDTLSVAEASPHIHAVVESGETVLGGRGRSVSWESIQEHGVDASLTVVRVTGPRFEVNDWNRFRARFRRGAASYDLSCTDLAPWAAEAYRQGGVASTTDWYLTVSLGEPWEETNHCYKIVAAGIEIRERSPAS